MKRITIIGNAMGSGELRTTKTGKQVGEVTVAVNERYFDKTTNEWKDKKVEKFRVFAWDNKGKSIAGLEKGNRVFAEGELSTEEYTDKKGEKQFKYVVSAQQCYKLERVTTDNTVASNQAQNFTDDTIPF